MIIEYECSRRRPKTETWLGQVELLVTSPPYEFKVTARGSSLNVICGRSKQGYYLCIPTHGVATELAALGDTFWNLERFTLHHPKFSKADAISIIYALKAMSEYIAM